MAGSVRARLAVLVILGSAVPSLTAGDTAWAPAYCIRGCPHSMYNYWGLWTPWLWRLDAYCHPRPNIYPPPPCQPPDYLIRPYQCPGVNPRARPYYPNLGTPEQAPVEVAPTAAQFGMPH